MAEIDEMELGVNPGKIHIPEKLPLFTPADVVFFPGVIMPLVVQDEKTIRLVNEVTEGSGPRIIGSVLRKAGHEEAESMEDIHSVGTALMILRMLRMPDGSLRMIVQGIDRIEINEIVKSTPYLVAEITPQRAKSRKTNRLEALLRALRDDFDKMAELAPAIPDEFKAAVHSIEEPSALIDLIAANITIDTAAKQNILETIKLPDRIKALRGYLARELKVLEIGSKLQSDTREEIEKTQREYFLRQQLKQIKKELGEEEDANSEINDWKKKIDEAELPERVLEVANKELDRLEKINPASAEYSVVTTYLDWLVTLPWEKQTEDHLDLKEARKILDEDHYGLEDVKERILEVLAVRKLKPDSQGPIICLVGPPGVGKTSLGKSIARAMGRNFVRLSLGGVRDEAEIRGHRRTYVGALPGRIIQQLKKAESRNPLFMLDEIDKLGSDFRGDPSSALLEVLDPAQNDTFNDHYIEIDFDLSSVFFITTANYIEAIPPPLRDRMEVITLPGYIAREKVQIAKHYLVPRQIEANGLQKKHIRFTDTALDYMVNYYTREAGVRNLEREIGRVCRKIARVISEDGFEKRISVSRKNLSDYLGPQKLTPPWKRRKSTVGVTTGLAYTPVGGTVLAIETAMMPGRGGVKVTGQLGDVMKESAQIAHSWIKAHHKKLKIKENLLSKKDIHLHVPAGATPKDGPSAGITMCTSLASLLTGQKVHSHIAMTGEITLCGNVLPIGGLREKVVAANRARITDVIIPWDNKKDLEKIPEDVREAITFHPVKDVTEVLKIALENGNVES